MDIEITFKICGRDSHKNCRIILFMTSEADPKFWSMVPQGKS